MKKLLNTLYVTRENAYLALDGENVVVFEGETVIGRVPLHTLESIVTFGYVGASPALMGKCAAMNKQIVFMRANGTFLARVSGKQYGNILLRREQFRLCDDQERSLAVARAMIAAKLRNSAAVLRRALSDHAERINLQAVASAEETLRSGARSALEAENAGTLRGIEGEGGACYFSVFDDLVLRDDPEFRFVGRNRKPPRDRVNAMLSFGYALLCSSCVSALEAVGLDPYVGVLHTDRPGRCSLALDLCEELRAPLVDRFVLSAINMRMISADDFVVKEDGAVLFTDEGKKTFLTLWQDKKRDSLMHPFLRENVEWGMIPHVQARLLAAFVRGDIDAYPPFFWK